MNTLTTGDRPAGRRGYLWWLLLIFGTALHAQHAPPVMPGDVFQPLPPGNYRVRLGSYDHATATTTRPAATELSRRAQVWGTLRLTYRPAAHWQWQAGHQHHDFTQYESADGLAALARTQTTRYLPTGTRFDVLTDRFAYQDYYVGAAVRGTDRLWLGATLHYFRGQRAALTERAYARLTRPTDGATPYLQHHYRYRTSGYPAGDRPGRGWGLDFYLRYTPVARWHVDARLQGMGYLDWPGTAVRREAFGLAPFDRRLPAGADSADATRLLDGALDFTESTQAFRQSLPTQIRLLLTHELSEGATLRAELRNDGYRARALTHYRLYYLHRWRALVLSGGGLLDARGRAGALFGLGSRWGPVVVWCQYARSRAARWTRIGIYLTGRTHASAN